MVSYDDTMGLRCPLKLEAAQNQNLGPLLDTTLTVPLGFVMDLGYLDIARRRRYGKKSFLSPSQGTA